METENERKTAFAIELLKSPDNPLKAALVIEPNTGEALRMVHFWSNDEFVLSEKARLLKECGAKSFLPTKEEFAKAVYNLAEVAGFVDDKLKAFRLYGDIMGFIEKPGVNINNNVVTNRVMVVNSNGSNDEWEQKLLKQQKALTYIPAENYVSA